MRPLLLPSSYPPNLGGVETVCARLAAGLRSRGHEPLVVTNHEPRTLPARSTEDGIDVRRMAFRVPHRSARGMAGWALRSRRTRAALISLATRHGVDLVNVHCVSTNAGYGAAVARSLGVPLVVSMHGELTGDADSIYQRDPAARRRWLRLVDATDHVTAPSHHVIGEAEQYYGGRFPRSSVVPNGVDPEYFGEEPAPVGRTIVAAGRLVEVKGFDVLIDAISRLPDTFGDVRVLIAGDGPARESLSARIAADAVHDRVRLAGRLEPDALRDAMRTARAVVVPSRQEAFGLTAAEAMAAGVPVVASRIGGLDELVDDSTGWPVTVSDPDALAGALVRVLSEEREAARRAREARARARTFTWDACVEGHLDAYRAALSARARE